MKRILVTDPLSEEGLKILKQTREFQVDVNSDIDSEGLRQIIKDYDALIVRSRTKVKKEIIEASSNLKLIGRAGVGLDNIDLSAATQKGILVMNAPAGNTISTCEHTFSLLLSLSRNIPQANFSTKKGEWKRSKFMGVELYNKTLGIIGLGRIGTAVARRALSFGMRIIAYDPYLSQDVAAKLNIELVDLKELFSNSDYITIHTPLTDDTRHMLSHKEFALMKEGVRLVNCSRGGIIDEAALLEAIKSRKVAGCALDVFEKEPPFDSPLLKLDNVIVSPHLGASTEEAQVGVAIEIAEVVRDALLGRGIRNAVNFPCIEPEAYKTLQPWINLLEKMGLLIGQLVEGRVVSVSLNYSGEFIRCDVTSLNLALMKGLLSPILQETVNFVNSLSLAKERGIKISEQKSAQEEDFVNLIQVEVKTDKESRSIAGTVFANNLLRIVKFDEFYVEAIPEGNMIITANWDKPGIIGAIGTLLGKHNINIAAMTFGRITAGGKAISVINVDSPVSVDVLEKIRKVENILAVKSVKL